MGETEITVAEPVKRLKAAIHTESPRDAERGAQSGGESNQDADGKALLEALPDYLADGLSDPKRAGSLARQLGKALVKRTDMVFDETGLRLVKILPKDRKAVARWRVEHQRGYAVSAVNCHRESAKLSAVEAELVANRPGSDPSETAQTAQPRSLPDGLTIAEADLEVFEL